MSEWCTIESDPGVFSELIRKIGVKNVGVEEVYSLEDEALLQSISPIHGLIFLFKWTQSHLKRECLKNYDNDLFFANQVINNACATQAIISVLLNVPDLDIGNELNDFKTFTMEMDPQTRGLALGQAETIRNVHNSFARPEPFYISNDGKKPKKEGDAYHFVSYIPFKGKLYELDGLQEGPILIGDCNADNWIFVAKEEINKRIQQYATNEIRFNLLAVVANKKDKFEAEIARLNNIRGHLYKKYKELGGILASEQSKEADELVDFSFNHNNKIAKAQPLSNYDIPNQVDLILAHLEEIGNQIEENKMLIAEEEAKHKKFEEENVRRRHNYIPFIIELLKLTAKKGKLKDLVEVAKEKQKARNASKSKK